MQDLPLDKLDSTVNDAELKHKSGKTMEQKSDREKSTLSQKPNQNTLIQGEENESDSRKQKSALEVVN